ncbi:MAG TPA: cellulase family glycosylhydrolase, partial [Verrucomicrobiae bacterium]|nr:cellulase family glycosylhydrolase [Verrucomicrobiae bacterium]
LNTLSLDGLNATRTWSGAYCEPPTAFSIASNTLAPLRGRFICPWGRSAEPGYANGGNKFDLATWDPAYFKRLKDFVGQAGKRGVIVELNLFCPFYDESMWELSPMNARNNVNGIGSLARTNVYTLDKNGALLRVQEDMVRKIVTELKGFDNVYYEICNEPYFGGVTAEWQRHIADIITETELPFRAHHLISQNIANDKALVQNPHPEVSVFNFHYATPPETVGLNYGLRRVIGDNETGFRGTNDASYRMEAWDFIAAGGGLFNNLDYSFTAGHEKGTFRYPSSQPGGGSAELRRELKFLATTMQSLDFVRMQPANGVVHAKLPPGASVRVLAWPGEQYLVYLHGPKDQPGDARSGYREGEITLDLTLPSGAFKAQWLEPRACRPRATSRFTHWEGAQSFSVPAFDQDIALVVRRN